MTWSEQAGTSIVLPSDRVDGDGRNYIVIGEDVPPAIASQFTAALIFRTGKWTGSDPNPGSNTDLTGQIGGLYPIGFVYWALGINTAGNFELVSFYIIVPNPGGQGYQAFRRTVFSVAPPAQAPGGPPVTVTNGPVLSLGSNGGYSEGFAPIVNLPDGRNPISFLPNGQGRGGSIPAGVTPLIWAGTFIANTDAQGEFYITGAPWANAMHAMMVVPGDIAGGLRGAACMGYDLINRRVLVWGFLGGGGGAANTTVRVDYLGVGY